MFHGLYSRRSERDYGLSGDEAVEMAYENVLNEARMAIKGKKRPITTGSSS
jgi:hypothetical protein